MKNKRKIIVFASGTGTNFINLYENINTGKIVLLISNNAKCGAVKYAIENLNMLGWLKGIWSALIHVNLRKQQYILKI